MTILPSETEVLEAARMAEAAHLLLVTDGRRTILAPFVPTGFCRVSVHVKQGAANGTVSPDQSR